MLNFYGYAWSEARMHKYMLRCFEQNWQQFKELSMVVRYVAVDQRPQTTGPR